MLLVLDMLGEDIEAIDLRREPGRDGRAGGITASETCRAEPAVSAAVTGLMPCFLRKRRVCPRAMMWLSAVLMFSSFAPFTAMR